MTSDQFGLSASEWGLLKASPVYVLSQVAGADSHVDEAEWTALIDAVFAASNGGDPLVETLMRELSAELHSSTRDSKRDPAGALEGLRSVAQILDVLPDKGLALRETLMQIGAAIAESSGAQLTRNFLAHQGQAGWVRSSGTSAMERDALEAAGRALGLA